MPGTELQFDYGEFSVSWDTVADSRDTVVAQVATKLPSRPVIVKATGSSRKSDEDDYNESIGTAFAIGRALERLGKEMQKQAWRDVQS